MISCSQEQQTENLPPIIRSPDSSFETAATLADLEARILPESVEKIECAKVIFSIIGIHNFRKPETYHQERI